MRKTGVRAIDAFVLFNALVVAVALAYSYRVLDHEFALYGFAVVLAGLLNGGVDPGPHLLGGPHESPLVANDLRVALRPLVLRGEHLHGAVEALGLGETDLEARIQSIIRRLETVSEPQRIVRGDIEIDERVKSVTINGEPMSLSPKEFYLLALLASDLGRVYTTEEIIAELWGSDCRATGADVKQYVYQLRSKIERDPHSPRWIQNVKGFGYKLVI